MGALWRWNVWGEVFLECFVLICVEIWVFYVEIWVFCVVFDVEMVCVDKFLLENVVKKDRNFN